MQLRILHRAAAVAVALISPGAGSLGQDLLPFLLTGGLQGRVSGGDPFAPYENSRPAPRGFLRYEGRVDNYYTEERRDGSSPGLNSVFHQISASLPIASDSRLDIQAQSGAVVSQARNTDDQVAGYTNVHRRVLLKLTTDVSGSMQWNVVAGHIASAGSVFPDLGTGVAIHTAYGSVSLRLDRSTHSQALDLVVTGIRAFLPLDHELVTTSLDFRTGRTSVLEIGASRSFVSGSTGDSPGAARRFTPAGVMTSYRAAFISSLTGPWRVMAAVDHRGLEGHGEFLSDGSRYGSIHEIRYRAFDLVAGVKKVSGARSGFGADVRWSSVEGFVEGFLESWPFVSVFESPLALRALFRLEGSIQLAQFHAGGTFSPASWLEIGGGIAVMRMLPALRVESWQAGVLGMGRKAYSDRRLSVRSLDGGILSAGVRVDAGRVRFEYNASQFVPVRIQRTPAPPGTDPLTTTPAEGMIIRSRGGFFQSIGAQWTF